jgi:EAL domain-containing protein (putative c-di-GMP-specific phosphodiesterase class I)
VGATLDVDGHHLCASASIGIAVFPEDGADEDRLIRNSDAAMYHAKKWGHNVCRLYSPDMSHEATERLELEGAMRTALENHEFELYYQPQFDVRDGHCVGAEALLRWNHPTRGLMAPGDFIYVAEQAGLIGEIGRWVLETACAQAQAWLAEGLVFDRIAVNLSAREFVQRNILQSVVETLAVTELPAHRLELEITETIAMYSTEQILRILRSLRAEGVRLAIDDFGTGYSSLSYLKHFPVQTLKIAQDFMRDVDVDSQSAAIASMLITLCNALGLDIVAEGVETESQLNFLQERGCHVIQGYLFCRPVPAKELRTILEHGLSPLPLAWSTTEVSAR